jgi:hypothetical protein
VNVEAIAWSVEEGVFPVAEEARLIAALNQRGITCHRFKAFFASRGTKRTPGRSSMP